MNNIVGYKKFVKNGTLSIGVEYLPDRIKPSLMVRTGNMHIKCATFKDAESARYFMNFFAEFIDAPQIDWTGDDIPFGLLIEEDE